MRITEETCENQVGKISLLLWLHGCRPPPWPITETRRTIRQKTVTVKGTVTDYIWANPHVFLKLDAKDESGNTLHWVIEGQNAVTQASAGWTNATFKAGDQVIVEPPRRQSTRGRSAGSKVTSRSMGRFSSPDLGCIVN